MQTTNMSSSPGVRNDNGVSLPEPPTEFIGGHVLLTWLAALTAAWFVLPAHSLRILIPAMSCGVVAVSLAHLAARAPNRADLREAAVFFGALPFTLVPVLRDALSSDGWQSAVLPTSIALVSIGVILVAIDGLRRDGRSSQWLRATGFTALILAAFSGVMAGAFFENVESSWLYVHVLAIPAFTLFCWYLALRIPHLRWLFMAVMLGVSLPVIAMLNLSNFIFLGGLGFVLYVVLQLAFVFASERFLRTLQRRES